MVYISYYNISKIKRTELQFYAILEIIKKIPMTFKIEKNIILKFI